MNPTRTHPDAPSPAQRGPTSTASGAHQVLAAAMKHAASLNDLADAAVAFISQELSCEYVLVRLTSGSDQCDSAAGQADWSPLAVALSVKMAQTSTPVLRLLKSADGRNCAALAVRLECGDTDAGVVVAVTECESFHHARADLEQLRHVTSALSLAVETFLDRRKRQAEAEVQLATLARSVSYSGVDEFCYAIANGLRVETDTDLVAVGLVDGHVVRLNCLSGLDEFDPCSPGSYQVRESMEEAVDAGRMICVQRRIAGQKDEDSDGHPMTVQWQQASGNASVVSIPLNSASGTCVAVVSLQSRQGESFSAEDLETIQRLTAPLVAAIELMKSGQRTLLVHAWDSLQAFMQRVFGPLRVRIAAVLAVMAAIGGWMIWGVTDYVVHVPCTVVAAHSRLLSAPWESRLAHLYVRPGQMVQEGDLLARLDTRQLESEYERAVSELRAAEIAVAAAVQEVPPEPAEIGQAVSRRAAARAELQRIEQQLATADIRAPFRGQIISHDLDERVGETIPVGEPLFEIVPDGQLAVELDLPESVVASVASGQTGHFSMNARPGVSHACRVEHIEPRAEADQNGNVVTARAAISDQASWLRPGMQGVARISTGERPVWWVWLHSVIDTVDYGLWSLTGADVGRSSSAPADTLASDPQTTRS